MRASCPTFYPHLTGRRVADLYNYFCLCFSDFLDSQKGVLGENSLI